MKRLVIGLLGGVLSLQAYALDPKAQGRALGQTGNANLNARVMSGSATASIPGYTGSMNLDGHTLYGNGKNIALPGEGTTQFNACLTMSGNPDKNAQMACDSAKTFAGSTTSTYGFTKDDPLLNRAAYATNNAESILSANGWDLSSFGDLEPGQGCVSQEVTSGAETAQKVCYEYLTLTNNACTVGQVVQVDGDHLYSCDVTTGREEVSSCTVNQVVQVDPDHLYECRQTLDKFQGQKCTVGRVIQIDPDYEYRCTAAPKVVKVYTCTRELSVSCSGGDETCHQVNGAISGASVGNCISGSDYNSCDGPLYGVATSYADSMSVSIHLSGSFNGCIQSGNYFFSLSFNLVSVDKVGSFTSDVAINVNGYPGTYSPGSNAVSRLVNGRNAVGFFVNLPMTCNEGSNYVPTVATVGFSLTGSTECSTTPLTCSKNWINNCAELEARSL